MPIEPHACCIQPPADDVPIWRFMSVAKLLDILENECLHFARLDQFEDPWEGEPPSNLLWDLHASFDAKLIQIADHARRRSKLEFFVSSWYLAEHEPASMWKQYLGSDNSLAVCSTYGQLRQVLHATSRRIYLGLVQYDPLAGSRPLQPFEFVMSKRKSFEHEKEVRALLWNISDPLPLLEELAQTAPRGISVNIIPQNLIETIVVSPAAPNWLAPIIEKVLVRYKHNQVNVERSTLYEPADWSWAPHLRKPNDVT